MNQDLRPEEHSSQAPGSDTETALTPADILAALRSRRKLLTLAPICTGIVVLGASFMIKPTFTARTTFLPPQQQQSATSAAITQLGALAGLGGSAALKSPADQYVALMQSETVSDRIIEKFDLMQTYEAKYRFEARKILTESIRISVGKKDGLITVEADDHSPERAAEMANQYVVELRRMTSDLALTEAQQRRVFFEQQLNLTRDRLEKAQLALQASGFNPGALKAEPKAAADTYARLGAEVTAAEVRLQTLRRTLADGAPEVQQQLGTLTALRSQLAKAEASGHTSDAGSADYVSRYRDFKYQETLFDLFSRQYEMARLDESREGALVQVVDVAQTPEWKSKPKRAQLTITAGLITLVLLTLHVLWREFNPWATRRA
ncbi:Wzz/FepE/Etk N-terminal domain-containing protein [Rubrivivax gelatinosus]|uniref:Lipopolysaccharide biosynthesis protein n=1 Tax=Rubrivivax gelatinosus (strain NBRC 100245 / IL144) TaxID=983917 RepID=I0HWS3_RUBGI|nr:Wzz/FepE/Etk N-terminal domain-containing protein [Rubrivivax gelatinosus]BAL97460.1 lipopolysaccharide biosynthesis protein [Rubrivivax gelatinosus IL144]